MTEILVRDTVHDFKERLAFSETASHEEFWQAVYRKAFPNMVSNMLCSGRGESQRKGIDRIILLNNGKVLKVEEKIREAEYDDILLEHTSVDIDGILGWIEKDLQVDYLAYAFIQSKRCYLFPWDFLRRAWIENKQSWIDEYPEVKAKNKGYNTISVAVPIKVVYAAVNVATRVTIP